MEGMLGVAEEVEVAPLGSVEGVQGLSQVAHWQLFQRLVEVFLGLAELARVLGEVVPVLAELSTNLA